MPLTASHGCSGHLAAPQPLIAHLTALERFLTHIPATQRPRTHLLTTPQCPAAHLKTLSGDQRASQPLLRCNLKPFSASYSPSAPLNAFHRPPVSLNASPSPPVPIRVPHTSFRVSQYISQLLSASRSHSQWTSQPYSASQRISQPLNAFHNLLLTFKMVLHFFFSI